MDLSETPAPDPASDPVETPALAPEPTPQRPRVPGFGEQMPRFIVNSDANPRFRSTSLGGMWLVMGFFGSLGLPQGEAVHARVLARRSVFDDNRAYWFGVSADPADRTQRGLKNSMPGLRYFWDFDQAMARGFGLVQPDGYVQAVFLIDPNQRVVAVEPAERIDALIDRLEAELAAEGVAPPEGFAPVLTVPRVLEPEFCRTLIDYYEARGGTESGFMREVDGVTYPVLDNAVKRRRDLTIEDEPLRLALKERLARRLTPQIHRVFNWSASRVERYIVARYSAEERGLFRAHRDNTTGGTAHRRFAVSINLNDDFDGGDLRFPEYGTRTYRPPLGGATVFNCSLLHEATTVTRGVRYATLPFLYDEAGSRQREASRHMVATAAPGAEIAPEDVAENEG